MEYIIKNEFASLLRQTNKNKSYKLVWDIFYYTRLLKYVHQKQYKEIRERLKLAATKKTLGQLCELNYLKEVDKQVYCATDKALKILESVRYQVSQGYDLELLPEEPVGKAGNNELNNTKVFLQALRLPDYHALVFPNFGYLIPDALLVRKKDKSYKLTFLEVEVPKPNWHSYLEDKRKKYMRLAQDIEFYNYWQNTGPKLKLSVPDINGLKFSVCVVGNIVKDYGEGFVFNSELLPI